AAKYNRHRPARSPLQRPSSSVNTVALTGHPRYARRHVICGVPSTSRARSRQVMTTFDKREEAFEQQFAHDEELKFKATARRNKMLGLWAAQKLGLSGAEAENYAQSIGRAKFAGGDPAVIAKVRNDLQAKAVAQSEHQIS